MSYRRVLLIVELGGDAAPAAAAIRRLAPEAERLIVVAHAPGREIALLSHGASGDRNAAASSLEALRTATAGLARNVELMLAEELGSDALAALAKGAGIDLVAAAGLPASAIPLLAGLRRRLTLPLLWIGDAPAAEGPMREIACAAFGARALGAVAAFLRDHGSADSDARFSARASPTPDSPRRFRSPGSTPASSSRLPARPASRRPTSS